MLFCVKAMLEPSPAFADAAFQKVAFYSSFEKFLWNRDKQAVGVLPVVCCIYEADLSDAAMLSFGKKPFNAFLAAQSFFLRKSIRRVCVHLVVCEIDFECLCY